MAGRLWWEGEIRAGEGSRPDQYLGVLHRWIQATVERKY